MKFLLCLLTAYSLYAQSTPLFSWIQAGPRGLIARSITQDTQCPEIQFDVQSKQIMSLRVAPNDEFPVRVCELQIPNDVSKAFIAGQSLPLSTLNQSGAWVALGDTGCRIKIDNKKSEIQACLNENEWPFAQIIRQIKEQNPSFVLHVGDYNYRTSACPKDSRDLCGNSPHGDNWATWKVDFFDPAATLLAQVPWIFVRGNHEACTQFWQGWFRFFDPRPYQESCQDITEPYNIQWGNERFTVFDTALLGELDDDDMGEAAQTLAKQTTSVESETWWISHVPFWAAELGKKKVKFHTDSMQSAYPSKGGPELVISGHVHFYQELKSPQLTQLIIGNGGSILANAPPSNKMTHTFDDQKSFVIETRQQFGYVVFNGNQSTLMGVDNEPITRDEL